MGYLILSILASTAVLIIFKLMKKGNANTRHSISLSYAVSALFGIIVFPSTIEIVSTVWIYPAAVEGIAFYMVFQAMARTAQSNGVAVASVAAKMSVVIPITIGLVFLGETVNSQTVAGILLGLGSILLSAGGQIEIHSWRWPVFVFIGSGLIDASFKLFQIWGLATGEFPGFIVSVFFFAFTAGVIDHLRCTQKTIAGHSFVAGLFLGLANFGTVYFLLNALAVDDMGSSVIYALNNFGIVALATLVAVAFFREQLGKRNWFGLGLATLSIYMIFSGSV